MEIWGSLLLFSLPHTPLSISARLGELRGSSYIRSPAQRHPKIFSVRRQQWFQSALGRIRHAARARQLSPQRHATEEPQRTGYKTSAARVDDLPMHFVITSPYHVACIFALAPHAWSRLRRRAAHIGTSGPAHVNRATGTGCACIIVVVVLTSLTVLRASLFWYRTERSPANVGFAALIVHV